MTSRQPAPELQRCISAALASARTARRGPSTGSMICAGVVALAISPLPATALTLGELATGSRLGQPLKATIPVRLAPGEMLNDRCVTPGGNSRELEGPQGLRFSVPSAQGPGNFEIAVTTARALVEPMYEIAVSIDCQGTPRLLRHYVLMLDLPGLAPVLETSSGTTTGARGAAERQVPAPAARTTNPVQQPRLSRSREPIEPGSSYRVREGDTLSTIAERIDGRPANSTWQLAEQIFAANPPAFIRNNPDLIKLGFEIRIPELGLAPEAQAQPAPATGSTPSVIAQTPSEPPAPGLPVAAAAASVSMAETTKPATPAAETTSPASEATGAAAMGTVAGLPELREPFVAPEVLETAEAPVAARPDAPPPVVITEPRATQLSPLLAVLLGILLGVVLSFGLLRTRALERASEMLRRGQRSTADKSDTGTFVDTDEWLDPTDTEVGSLPVRAPAEETYVVEVATPEPSEVIEAEGTGNAFDPDALPVAERTAADGLSEAAAGGLDAAGADVETSAEFADVFTDAMEGRQSEPDLPLDDPFAGTAETVEQPAVGPTEELPHFNSSGLGFDEEAETEELASLEADDTHFEDTELGALDASGGDETRLSSTLREALSLLEQDYDEEMTASQVIDQKAIEEALSDEEAAELQRKLGS